MLEFIFNNLATFGYILLILFIIVVIIGYLLKDKINIYVNDNWDQYKSNPFFVFFGGFFRQDENSDAFTSAFNNFVSFINTIVQNLIGVLLYPFVKLSGVFVKLLGKTSETLNKFRGQFAVMRGFMFSMTDGILERLNNLNIAFTMFFLKVREGLKKQAAIFNLMAWTVAHSYYFLYSTFMGPVGNFFKKTARLQLPIMNFVGGPFLTFPYVNQLCFHSSTRISNKFIKDINFNDDLDILGLIKIKANNTPLYKINDTYVTGSHYIFNDGLFEFNNRVQKCGFLPELYYNNYLFCLVSKNGLIRTDDGSLFADFLDTTNISILKYIQSITLQKLNDQPIQNILSNFELNSQFNHFNENINDFKIWGFNPNSILLTNTSEIKLSDIEPGMILDGNEISAVIRIRPYSIQIFNFDGLLLSANNIIFFNDQWIRVKDIPDIECIGLNETEYINIIIKNSLIYFKSNNNLVIARDYLENDDIDWNNFINEKIDYLNSPLLE